MGASPPTVDLFRLLPEAAAALFLMADLSRKDEGFGRLADDGVLLAIRIDGDSPLIMIGVMALAALLFSLIFIDFDYNK